MDAFEAGNSFTVNDGIGSGWYIVPPVAVTVWEATTCVCWSPS